MNRDKIGVLGGVVVAVIAFGAGLLDDSFQLHITETKDALISAIEAVAAAAAAFASIRFLPRGPGNFTKEQESDA